jgi:replication factor A1
LNQRRTTIAEHLAFLSVKYSVNLSELFQSLVAARKNGNASCENLTVEYRGSIRREAIFLITKDNKVIVQFRTAEEFLQRKEICFERWMDSDKIRRQISKQNSQTNSTRIQDMQHGMKKVNLEAKVIETSEPQLVHTQYGNMAKVTNAWIADETGKIKLCLWNGQADSITVGDTIQIKNASVATYKGERQLRLGKTGGLFSKT